MSCTHLMWINPPTLGVNHSVEDAAHALLRSRVRSLPVVDDDGQLVGMFGIHQLLELMAPRIANIEHGLQNMAFVNDDIADLRRRLGASSNLTVGELMSRDYTTLSPDSPLTQAVQLLHCGADSLPVIAKNTGGLLGLVTYWGVLKAVTKPETEDND
jgi:CBS domain-containing protein